MPANSALRVVPGPMGQGHPLCWIVATPEVRRRLLGLAIAALAPAFLPHSAGAQSSAGGTVRLIVRADVVPSPTGSPQSSVSERAPAWMEPEALEASVRVADLWADGNEAAALETWRSLVKAEVAAERLSEPDQVDPAVEWIVFRARRAALVGSSGVVEGLSAERERSLRRTARREALASLESRLD